MTTYDAQRAEKNNKGGPDWSSFTSIFKWTVKVVGIPGTIVLVVVLAPYIKEFIRPASSEQGFDVLGRIETKLEAHMTDESQKSDEAVRVLKAILDAAKDRNDYARAQTALLRLICRDQVNKDLKPQCEK